MGAAFSGVRYSHNPSRRNRTLMHSMKNKSGANHSNAFSRPVTGTTKPSIHKLNQSSQISHSKKQHSMISN